MSVNLQKGQKVDLTKGNAGLRRVMVGLGWDEAQQTQSRGLFGGLFGGGGTAMRLPSFWTETVRLRADRMWYFSTT